MGDACPKCGMTATNVTRWDLVRHGCEERQLVVMTQARDDAIRADAAATQKAFRLERCCLRWYDAWIAGMGPNVVPDVPAELALYEAGKALRDAEGAPDLLSAGDEPAEPAETGRLRELVDAAIVYSEAVRMHACSLAVGDVGLVLVAKKERNEAWSKFQAAMLAFAKKEGGG